MFSKKVNLAIAVLFLFSMSTAFSMKKSKKPKAKAKSSMIQKEKQQTLTISAKMMEKLCKKHKKNIDLKKSTKERKLIIEYFDSIFAPLMLPLYKKIIIKDKKTNTPIAEIAEQINPANKNLAFIPSGVTKEKGSIYVTAYRCKYAPMLFTRIPSPYQTYKIKL